MSDGEHELADVRGQVLRAAKDGRTLTDAKWRRCRLVLSSERLVVATNERKRTIPLESIDGTGGRHDVNQSAASVSDYVSLRVDGRVFLLAADDSSAFQAALYEAILDGAFMVVRHPAIEGGAVRETAWEKCQLTVEADRVGIATASGSFVDVVLEEIGGVTASDREVRGEPQTVLQIEHAEGSTSVQTFLAGSDRLCAFLGQRFRDGAATNRTDLEGSEQQILMALYSGVSPFEVPEFLGLEIDEVEAVYERLTELDVLEEVRTRREVTLTPRGRNVASEAINES